MADAAVRVFNDITRRTFDRMKDDMRRAGIEVPGGDSCEVQHRGTRALITFSERRSRIAIEILEKPIFVSYAVAWETLDRLMERYTSTPASSARGD